jgi:MIP family channel proteins
MPSAIIAGPHPNACQTPAAFAINSSKLSTNLIKMNIKAFICEFVGTFALCFAGILAIAQLGDAEAGLIGIAFAHGLTIAVMVSATAAISGGHLNPAVTLGLLTAGKIDGKNAIGYIISQCLGGLVAAIILKGILEPGAIAGGTPALAEGVTAAQGITLEAITTFFLIFVIYGTAVDKRAPKVGGLFIGLTIVLDILAIGPLTGGAINPARQLGPALIGGDAGQIAQIWIYWVGPVLGGILAAQLWRRCLEKTSD